MYNDFAKNFYNDLDFLIRIQTKKVIMISIWKKLLQVLSNRLNRDYIQNILPMMKNAY